MASKERLYELWMLFYTKWSALTARGLSNETHAIGAYFRSYKHNVMYMLKGTRGVSLARLQPASFYEWLPWKRIQQVRGRSGRVRPAAAAVPRSGLNDSSSDTAYAEWKS
ncbi:hypothetical protein SRHO_G00062830 [Serrasalmus rhombeus]